jgi:hypothetical protein
MPTGALQERSALFTWEYPEEQEQYCSPIGDSALGVDNEHLKLNPFDGKTQKGGSVMSSYGIVIFRKLFLSFVQVSRKSRG